MPEQLMDYLPFASLSGPWKVGVCPPVSVAPPSRLEYVGGDLVEWLQGLQRAWFSFVPMEWSASTRNVGADALARCYRTMLLLGDRDCPIIMEDHVWQASHIEVIINLRRRWQGDFDPQRPAIAAVVFAPLLSPIGVCEARTRE